MKRTIKILLRVLLIAQLAAAQTLTSPPPPVSAYFNAGGGWNPWTNALGSAPLQTQPPPVGLYCQSAPGALWTPCNPASSSLVVDGITIVNNSGTISINLGNANIWTSTQTMPTLKMTGGSKIDDFGTNQGFVFTPGGSTFGSEFAMNGTTPEWSMNPNGIMGWLTNTFCCGHPDTGFSKISAGVVALGNGALGNKTGTLDYQQANFTPVTITTGATPAIGTASLQTITLSANATPTVTIATGEHLVLQICQPSTGGPFTWTWPGAIHGGVTIGTTASTCTQQAFDSFNGTTLVAENAGVTNIAP